jgi:hypothetical protein
LPLLAAGTFLLAWIMTKFTEPVRLGMTVLVVPKLGKFLYAKKKEKEALVGVDGVRPPCDVPPADKETSKSSENLVDRGAQSSTSAKISE